MTPPRATHVKARPASHSVKRDGLTRRQLQVCALVAEGKRNKEIAI